jgi:phosphopantothenoylcysteine decarboxylase/phosphopantothenate--cysteine ligase
MARILISSGPTRQYLDPVRYLTNASSGRMGRALAQVAAQYGHEVVVVSGPVPVEYPEGIDVIPVITTEEMLEVCQAAFQTCDGFIGVAAPCDYRPTVVHPQKISKDGMPLLLQLVETPDVVATIGGMKGSKWVVGFALETQDHHFRAITKLHRKRCDLIVLNGPEAMDAADNEVQIIDPRGEILLTAAGDKEVVAERIFAVIQSRLID